MADHVVLLHGLWMRPLALAPLARLLRGEGFEVSVHGYPSVARSPDEVVDGLRERLAALRGRTVHLVGHSLGGLIALQALRDERGLPPGRVVCLGSPLLGSRTARAVSAWPIAILTAYAHKFTERPGFVASATGIMIDPKGVRLGAIDSRSDGMAVGSD